MRKAHFNTTESDFVKYNGSIVDVVRPLSESEIDIEEVGRMYEIILPDGKKIEAFQDELTFIVQLSLFKNN